ncbi:MAG: TetR family transcriptional regulator [Flavobacteriaceae bacterium]|nr:TetR family transcriptional regulator [Flavobacteriaceae bacterium]|tara:strand:+ start:10535 stop:11143 length:609 start_codon:yes stop_codon:yes gene_type:complete
MKEKIIEKSAEMFLNLGFKSVTMDDIAQEMGISKKTIYLHFKNKTELVHETVMSVFHDIVCGIDHIREQSKDPIEELFEIKKFAMVHLKYEKSSPQYQLQKYYPEVYAAVTEKKFENMNECTVANLERGVASGVYRSNIDVPFISRIYFLCLSGLSDESYFPTDRFPKIKTMADFLEYHLRGIVTAKGAKKLDTLLNQQENA